MKLTDKEIDYCTAEGIPIADFLKRKEIAEKKIKKTTKPAKITEFDKEVNRWMEDLRNDPEDYMLIIFADEGVKTWFKKPELLVGADFLPVEPCLNAFKIWNQAIRATIRSHSVVREFWLVAVYGNIYEGIIIAKPH